MAKITLRSSSFLLEMHVISLTWPSYWSNYPLIHKLLDLDSYIKVWNLERMSFLQIDSGSCSRVYFSPVETFTCRQTFLRGDTPKLEAHNLTIDSSVYKNICKKKKKISK